MSLIKRIRFYHTALACLTVFAWLSGDFGLVHEWLGYAVAAVIGFRLLWAVFNPRQLGLSRFYPDFDGLAFGNAFHHPAVSRTLILGVAASVIGATVTGLPLDSGSSEGILEDIHEILANIVFVTVVLHAAYLLTFRRPLARFMLFRDRRMK